MSMTHSVNNHTATAMSPITVFGAMHPLAVPRVQKITVAAGVGKTMRDEKNIATVERTLERITGQKPIRTLAKKSISSFKVRKGMVVGLQVTLRGRRMRDFLEKLIHVTLPRVRDFRGIDRKTIDAQGNCTIGFREHIAFPEIRPDEVDTIHGVAVTITTGARTRDVGLALLQTLGFPFRESEKRKAQNAKQQRKTEKNARVA